MEQPLVHGFLQGDRFLTVYSMITSTTLTPNWGCSTNRISSVDTIFPQGWQHLNSITASVSLIDPVTAQSYLDKNFDNNRDKSREHINELAKEMKNNLFEISCDAIGFDVTGRLINGQHRLTAVVESGTPQPFVVIRGLPSKTAQLIDVGKKRTMAQRITIGGSRMTEKQCALVRNAITDYQSNEIGTVTFAKKIHDRLVEQMFLAHKEFLCNPLIMRFEGKGSSFWGAAALRIYATMIQKVQTGYIFNHGMSPLQRAVMWLELTRDGMSQDFCMNPQTDNVAIIIKNHRDQQATDSRGNRWSSKHNLRLTLCAAYHFMNGNNVKTLRVTASDPFPILSELPSTNGFLK
jgi:hypothetical protein